MSFVTQQRVATNNQPSIVLAPSRTSEHEPSAAKPQRATSNQTMQRALRSGVIQAKLTVNTPNDEYEQEADRVADQVMRMSAGAATGEPPPNIQRACTSCSKESEEQPIQRACKDCDEELKRKQVSSEAAEISSAVDSLTIQRMCDECEDELGRKEMNSLTSVTSTAMESENIQRMCDGCEEELSRKERNDFSPEVSGSVESQINALQGSGQPLPLQARSFFEPRFGRDFSDVRVHVDALAAETAQSINALAYTRGSHIVFGAGQYQPNMSGGQRLLAHELAHTVQQSDPETSRPIQRAPCPGPRDQNGDQPVDPSRECTVGTDTVGGAHFLFCKDSDQMQDASQALLPKYIPDLRKISVVEVHGYASPEGPKGKEAAYNLNLSCRRANRAADLLEDQGIPSARIRRFKHGGTSAYGPVEQNRSVVIPIPSVHDLTVSAVSLLACAPCNPFTDDGLVALNPPTSESALQSFRQKHAIAGEIISVDGRHIDPGSAVAGSSNALGNSEYCGKSSPAFKVSISRGGGAGTAVSSPTNVEGRRWESELTSRVGAVVPCTLWDPVGSKPGAPCGYLGNNASIPAISSKFFLELYADGTSKSGFISATKFPFHYLYENGQLKTAGGAPVHPVVDFDAWATSTGVSKDDAIIGFRALREACCQPSGKLLCPCECRSGETRLELPRYTDPGDTYSFCVGTFAHYLWGSCPKSCKPAGTDCNTLSMPANP